MTLSSVFNSSFVIIPLTVTAHPHMYPSHPHVHHSHSHHSQHSHPHTIHTHTTHTIHTLTPFTLTPFTPSQYGEIQWTIKRIIKDMYSQVGTTDDQKRREQEWRQRLLEIEHRLGSFKQSRFQPVSSPENSQVRDVCVCLCACVCVCVCLCVCVW